MTEPLIRLEGLCLEYGKAGGIANGVPVAALHQVTLAIERGEFAAVIGPSGSGKTSLLYVLGCLLAPTAGRYLLEGRDIRHNSARQLAGLRNQRIGFVFQSFNLVPRLTAQEQVELPMRYAGVRRRQRSRRARDLLAATGMSDRAHHLPSELSGGQKQRVAIARALANNPALILADEPTAALDRINGEAVMTLLHGLRDQGVTVVLVTHDPVVARTAKRIIGLDDGRVVSDTSLPLQPKSEKAVPNVLRYARMQGAA